VNGSRAQLSAAADTLGAEPASRARILWLWFSLWVGALVAAETLSVRLGWNRVLVNYVLAANFGSMGVISLLAFRRLVGTPRELRSLRLLAVVLPSAFVLFTQIFLYFMEIDERINEVVEHIIGTALLSTGAIPFSVFIFRVFTAQRDELTRRAASLQLLHTTSMALTREPALPALHELIAQGARSVTGAERAALLAPSGRFVTAPPGGLLDGEEEILSEATAGLASDMPGQGRKILVARLARGPQSGAIAVARRSGFAHEDRFLLDMYAVAVTASLDSLHRMQEAQIIAALEERERIARDLHDDTGQLLGFLTANVQAVRELLSRGAVDRAQEELAELERAARLLSGQVREAILGLRTKLAPGRHLGSALADYVAEFGIQSGIDAIFEGDLAAGSDLPAPAEYQLLRIAQEALSNVRRHAEARRVTVEIVQDAGEVRLSVADDGIGFDPGADTGGFGLQIMAERARTLEGTVEVVATPGRGTEVRARVPAGGR